jgi:hypothetical protein
VRPGCSGAHQLLAHARHREGLPDGKIEGAAGDERHGWQALQQRLGANQQHARGHGGQAGQGGDAFGHQVWQWRVAIVGQHFPVRQLHHRQVGAGKEQQLAPQLVEVAGIGSQHHPQPAIGAGGGGQRQGARAGLQRWPHPQRLAGVWGQGNRNRHHRR